MKMDKVNENIIDFWSKFNLRSESLEYKVPIYYILGENDWQTPYVIAEEYFQKIKAPTKKIFVIPNAGHMTMVDQPNLFFEALSEIKGIE